ncbi:hypothetical protein JRQ81_002286, partial [Phrynocephalus forsythii]
GWLFNTWCSRNSLVTWSESLTRLVRRGCHILHLYSTTVEYGENRRCEPSSEGERKPGEHDMVDKGDIVHKMEKMRVNHREEQAGKKHDEGRDLISWDEGVKIEMRTCNTEGRDKPIIEGLYVIDMSINEWEAWNSRQEGAGEGLKGLIDVGVQAETIGINREIQTKHKTVRLVKKGIQTEQERLTAKDIGLLLPLPVTLPQQLSFY